MEDKQDLIEAKIDLDKFLILMRDFKRYYEGFTRHNAFAKDNLLNFYGELQEIIFGERKILSWA